MYTITQLAGVEGLGSTIELYKRIEWKKTLVQKREKIMDFLPPPDTPLISNIQESVICEDNFSQTNGTKDEILIKF